MLFESIAKASYLTGKVTPSCKTYNTWEVFKYNMLFWNVMFMLGLNFTHADFGPMQHLTLDPAVMKTWGRGMWTLFICLMTLITAILVLEVKDYVSVGIFSYYLCWASILTSFLVWKTKKEAE